MQEEKNYSNNKNNKTKCGFVALIGATNSGKSTLLNTILATKVSITSHKVQTTRNQIRGIKTDNDTQIIFIDTPGIFNPKGKFDKAMVSSAWSAMNDSDCIIFLLDAHKGITDTFNNIVKKLRTVQTPIALCLNKVDLLEKEELLKLTAKIMEIAPDLFREIFMISALQNDGVNDLIDWVKEQMPQSPFYFDSNIKSDLPLELRLSEITREKVYELLHQELPYAITIKTDRIEEEENSMTVRQTIYTSSENHKSIIIGAKGSKLKSIGMKAREEMALVVGEKVNLFLFVKVKENWRDTPEFFTDIGLEFKK
ncbi:MAG: GTPase Era [Alphaproteobacteria bacterium]|nr:GTPase Era [Alphaproteobacteria bacterium]